MLASIENVYKVFNGEELLKDINLTIEDGDRIGLVGINGCGKTTLLSILTGKLDFDKTEDGRGSVAVTNSTRIGYLEQHTGLEGDASIQEEMRKPFAQLDKAYERMNALEDMMSRLSGDDYDKASAE